jgi:hypothetical protein
MKYAKIIGEAVGGNAQATVSFTVPDTDGGSPITGYTVTSDPGGLTGTGTSSPITVTGLTNGTAYTFTVAATNAVGTGATSSPSNSIIPATVPDAPTAVSAVAGNTQATISFTAPASNGGSAITSYTVTDNTDTYTATGTSSPITVTGLTNGDTYSFTVTATRHRAPFRRTSRHHRHSEPSRTPQPYQTCRPYFVSAMRRGISVCAQLFSCLLALRRCNVHYAGNLAEDRADTGCDTRHDSTGGNGNKTSHQRILDEVLSASVFQNLQLQNQIIKSCHFHFSKRCIVDR